MPYVERVTKAGNTIEIERYFTSRYKKKGISRGDKVKPTKEEQEKVNTRQAERKLRILINANYGYGDYHLVLDYIRRKGEPDRTPEQMRQDIDVFLRECRKEYRKAGLEFKYIHVMEIGKKGARHHHLVVNKIDTEILQRCWYKAYEGHNRVKVFPLDDSGNYAELASYLIKYTGTHKKGTDGALQGNSCAGIDGAIRKVGMLISLVFMLAIDVLIKINLIGFIPEQARTYLGLDTVGVAEFFALLYIAYEVVSIFKNMALCGLPVKKVWEKVREFLAKYTDELPDTDELDGDSTTGSVEEHRTQER